MYKIEIVDAEKPIVSLKWSGVVDKKEALDVIPDIKAAANKVGKKFYFLVDVSEIKLNKAVEEFAEHQKATLPYMLKVLVVVDSSITKLQVRQMAKASGNDKEVFFKTYEEAVAYGKAQPTINVPFDK